MSTTHCPDCLQPVPPRKRSQDARCDYCRAEVGQERQHGRRRRRPAER